MEKQAIYMSASKMHADLPAVIPVFRNLLVEDSRLANGFIYHFPAFSTCRSSLNSMATKPKAVSNTGTPWTDFFSPSLNSDATINVLGCGQVSIHCTEKEG